MPIAAALAQDDGTCRTEQKRDILHNNTGKVSQLNPAFDAWQSHLSIFPPQSQNFRKPTVILWNAIRGL